MMHVVTQGARQVVTATTASPEPGPGELALRVIRVGICGSDAHVYDGSHPYLGYPQVQGHEVVGIVEKLGPGTSGPEPGRTVVVEPAAGCGDCYPCRRGRPNCCTSIRMIGINRPGGLSELLLVPAGSVHDVGELDPDAAVFVEPLAVALHALSQARFELDDAVLVLGGGSMGRATALAALHRGARVLVAERTPSRRPLIAGLGPLRVTSTDVEELRREADVFGGGEGCTAVIDTTGSARLLELATEFVAPSGTVVVVGISGERLSIPVALLSRKEFTLRGARNSLGQFPAAVRLAAAEQHALLRTITDRFGLGQAEQALRLALEGSAVGKVLIQVAQ